MRPDTKNQRPGRKGQLVFLTGFFALLAIVGLFGFRRFFPSHPLYGAVYEAAAFDLNEARSDRIGVFLRAHLPRRIVQSPHFPSRYKDQPRYLDLKGARLEWSIGGPGTGWLYFWDVESRSRVSRWEFAPCSQTNLLGVSELPTDFCGSSEPRVGGFFGESSTTNAIQVAVGQILFARRTDERSTIYILKLKEQDGNRLIVDYCVTTR
jgi:hypothetical protein